MSLILILCVLAFAVQLLSQFGGRLAAGKSLLWWSILVFLVATVIDPGLLTPIARAAGVQVESNLFFAVMIVFLLFQMIQETVTTTALTRKLREWVCLTAAENYLRQNAKRPTGEKTKRVLVVVPCYNEERAVGGVAEALESLPKDGDFLFDYLLVNDGSRDKTLARLERFAPQRFASHGVNVGVAGVLLTGFKIALAHDYDYAIQCDGDGQHPIESIPGLLAEAERGEFDLLIGSRFMPRQEQAVGESTTVARRFGGVLISLTLKMFGKRSWVADPTSGLRVYSRRAFSYLVDYMPDEYPEPENIALLALVRARIGEAPVAMKPRLLGKSSLSGWHAPRYMVKVVAALVGLRLRSLYFPNRDELKGLAEDQEKLPAAEERDK